jgi:phospholipid/cholesterol/gamma-HCH transport system ATP-binding protein
MNTQSNRNNNSNSENDVVVHIKNLEKSFGNNTVLKKINIELNHGENLVVLGKSGSGKSVLIKCMVGLIPIDGGEIIIQGDNITEMKMAQLNIARKKIGFLFQSGALYDSLSVRENLAFPLRDQTDMSESEKTTLIEEALENVSLEESIDKMPSELSGGMRKRLGLARTLILKPDIMLYDEPTTGLDPITSKEISELILTIQKKYHTSSIIITHDMACAKITANRIIVLDQGEVVEMGNYNELSNSKIEMVHSFFNNQ